MRRFFARMDSIVTTSPNYFASSRVLQAFSEKVEVIPIGLEEASYPALDPAVVKELEEAVGSGFFLFVGALRYYKGLNILLDAIAGTDLPVVIAGAGSAEPELRAKQRELGLTNVRFLGHVSNAEKVALYDLARAVVFPSHLRSEAFGVTLVEGAMYGKALISTEIGTGTSYVNVHEETGLIVPPADSKGLREAMRRLAGDAELAAQMGTKARERFERLFTASRMGERYAQLYSGLV
jgi:rhamnosyl/mannosyltransferase